MKKYYVFDAENQYRKLFNFTCLTQDIEKYINAHPFGVVRNLREITKDECKELKKSFKAEYKC